MNNGKHYMEVHRTHYTFYPEFKKVFDLSISTSKVPSKSTQVQVLVLGRQVLQV